MFKAMMAVVIGLSLGCSSLPREIPRGMVFRIIEGVLMP